MQIDYSTTDGSLQGWLASLSDTERETIARLWGIAPQSEVDVLADAMLVPEVVGRVLAALSEGERSLLERVLGEQDAALPAAVVEREWGSVRHHEAYVNPRAYLLALQQPPSATERLFTLGLLHRRRQPEGYFIPHDLLPLLPQVPLRDTRLRLVAAPTPEVVVEARTDVVETNLVAMLSLAHGGELTVIPTGGMNRASLVRLAQRWGQRKEDLQGLSHEKRWPYARFLRAVAEGAGLLRVNTQQELRTTGAALKWLRLPQVERLRHLVDGWVNSNWDELASFLGIEIKGYAFGRDLPATKGAMLDLLRQAPADMWVSWDNLLDEVQRAAPDFARPSGRYDNWRLQNYRGESLDGYSHWREVEGGQLRATLGTTLRWLGLVDYGGANDPENSEQSLPTGFRLNTLGAAVLEVGPAPAEPVYEPLVLQGTFELLVPLGATPLARFEADRCAQLVGGKEVKQYKLTKESVQAAVAAGMSADEIVDFLRDSSGLEPPPNVAYSVREWGGQYGQLSLSQGALLRSGDPLLLEQMRRDRRIRMPEHETLTPNTILLAEGDAAALGKQLRKAGYGLAGEIEEGAGTALKGNDLTLLYGTLEFYVHACIELGIESEASGALQQRMARLLNQRQAERASKLRSEALRALKKRLGRN